MAQRQDRAKPPAPEKGRAVSWLARTIPGLLLVTGAIGFAWHGDPEMPGGCVLISALAMFGVSAILHFGLMNRLALLGDEVRPAALLGAVSQAGLSLVTASLAAQMLARAV